MEVRILSLQRVWSSVGMTAREESELLSEVVRNLSLKRV